MSVRDLNDKAALLVVALLGYFANRAVVDLEKSVARVEAHIESVDAVARGNLKSLIRIETILHERGILP